MGDVWPVAAIATVVAAVIGALAAGATAVIGALEVVCRIPWMTTDDRLFTDDVLEQFLERKE
jgi:hypothetical protein